MKKLFLTSSLGTNQKIEGERIPCIMDNTNGLVDILHNLLDVQQRIVLISSNPYEYAINDNYLNIYQESFSMSGFNFKEVAMLDNRNANEAADLIKYSNLIILCGGHVPTQNEWFKKINLKQLLIYYDGVIIGSSAGSMNCADSVYSPPELEGEALDQRFKRWIGGLGLTKINIFPHFSDLKDEVLDGMKMVDDIVLPDSFNNVIYALNDGSHIEVDSSKNIIKGECYRIYNGEIIKICETGEAKII